MKKSLSILAVFVVILPSFSRANTMISSTYLGGSGEEGWQYTPAISVVVHTSGDVYVAGRTASADFPVTVGAYREIHYGGTDLFVACFTPGLSTVKAATFVGGHGGETFPRLAIDLEGNIVLAGLTSSSDYPTTAGAYQTSKGSGEDAFVSVFSADLTELLASTFLGTSGNEGGVTMAIDQSGNIFIAGTTSSSGFPVVTGSHDLTINGGSDFFVSKLSSDLSSLLASTFLGGRYNEELPTVGVDASGYVYIGGGVKSNNFPVTVGAYDETFNGSDDIGLAKFSNDLSTLIAATYVGTSGYETAKIMTVRQDGVVYVGGHTDAVGYPTTPGVLDTEHDGINEYFITRLSGDLSTLQASTLLSPGAAGFIFVNGITTAPNGNVLLAGPIWEYGWYPVSPNTFDSTYNSGINDGFFLELDEDLTEIRYATYFGGTAEDGEICVSVAQNGTIYLAGYTKSTDAPVTSGSFNETYAGGLRDAIVACFSTDGCCGFWTGGVTGNVDCSEDGKRNLADITRLIDRVYVSKLELCCEESGNIDVDLEGKTNLADITQLIDHVYISKAETNSCF